jgi:hypothetical protein
LGFVEVQQVLTDHRLAAQLGTSRLNLAIPAVRFFAQHGCKFWFSVTVFSNRK